MPSRYALSPQPPLPPHPPRLPPTTSTDRQWPANISCPEPAHQRQQQGQGGQLLGRWRMSIATPSSPSMLRVASPQILDAFSHLSTPGLSIDLHATETCGHGSLRAPVVGILEPPRPSRIVTTRFPPGLVAWIHAFADGLTLVVGQGAACSLEPPACHSPFSSPVTSRALAPLASLPIYMNAPPLTFPSPAPSSPSP